MKFIRILLKIAVGIALGMVAAGFFGALHPALNSFSHFRLHLAAGGIVVSVLLALAKMWRLASIAALGFLLAVTVTLWPIARATQTAGTSEAFTYRFMQVNVRFDNPDRKAVLRVIASAQPDIIALEEVTAQWRDELESIKSAYPFAIYCDAHGKVGEVVILSRRPFVDHPANSCGEASGLVIQAIDLNGKTLLAGTVHLHWPWPFRQYDHVEEMKGVLEKAQMSGLPLIIGGDMNAVSWSFIIKRFNELCGTRTLPYLGGSWLPFELPETWTSWAGLPLDNIFVLGVSAGPVMKQANTGSDHLPILANFSLPDPTKEADGGGNDT